MKYDISLAEFLRLMENPWFRLAIILLAIWSLIWKGIALWKASQRKQMAWFIVLLCVNTVGILEILYLFLFGKSECCCCEKKKIPPPQNPQV